MSQGKIFHWLSFTKLILTKGSVWIKPFHYQNNAKALWSGNPEAKKLGINDKLQNRSFKHYILFLPIIGPLVGLISQYRLQKRWPTYVYHWPEKKLAYVRISKSACTSVQAAILQKQYPDVDISSLGVDHINEMGKMYIKPYLEPGYECFTLVRNPHDRILSCYFDQVLGRDHHFYYGDYAFRIIKKGMPFRDFVNTIKHIPHSLKDIHFRQQYEYIRPLENIKYFRIEKDYKELTAYLEKFNLQLGDFNKNKIGFNKSDYFTTEIKRTIEEIYRKDYEYFGYSIN